MIINKDGIFVGVTEMKRNLKFFMKELEADPELVFLITRYGKPVAAMISHKKYQEFKGMGL